VARAIETGAAVTGAVARYACRHDLAGAPDELLTRARRAVVDTVGVAIAALREPSFTILASTIGAGGEHGEATVLPTGARTDAARAAFLNGTAGHALDYDDVADEIKGHPSVVLVPALLAVAEAEGSSGRALLEAFVVGFEVACAIARGLPVAPHYLEGWHATATVGVIGAAAGAARLLGLDEARTRCALGIAASMASGSRQNFGTMTKPLHAGLAARDAVIAARLAAHGFTADPDQLEGLFGYFRMYGVDPEPAAVLEGLEGPGVLLTKGLNVKKYPCCYNTHRTADAVLDLHVGGARGSDSRSVVVTLEPGALLPIIHHRPRTGLQGKFSGEYVTAAGLLDGSVGLSTFTDDAVGRPDHQDLLRRVELRESEVPPFGPASFEHAYAAVEVTLGDGSVVRERCDIPRGDARMPLDDADVEAKFRDCLAFAESGWDAAALLGELRSLESAPRVSEALSRARP
jgi:2-methylcitrate dehydratase PrpD